MRTQASVMHLDLDAFFASVEQRDKPSLRGKPVIVGGIGQRGVVSTASYEARVFGVRSAMPTHEARRRCPHAAFLAGRFHAYREASRQVMAILRSISPLVEPLSLDEAFVDLAAATDPLPDFGERTLRELVDRVKDRVAADTGGLTASVGIGSSKFIAKLATELDKPDGCRIVPAGTEVELIAPMAVGVIPGVGPVSRERLARIGARRIADLQAMSLAELTRELGKAAAANLHALAYARDDRPVQPDREAKSISVEDTFEHDLRDPAELRRLIERDAQEVASRVRAGELFARTVTLKVRLPDFTTLTRSRTLDGATDRAEVIARVARELLAGLDVWEGVRLLGVGVAGLTGIAQEELFTTEPDPEPAEEATDQPEQQAAGIVEADTRARRRPTSWLPGVDVEHDEHGRGWVWGAGLGRVTVRFETAETGPGPVRTLAADDPALHLVQA
ncbi:DNA polymerase IV [Enemella evansiae]|uniref:DNA polymerase IV n=1 Tax=Enemella evansiae TaxID=2016499 RepID=A0A255GKG3_9ACTN|nr:DNA polymerase IV [Enemella evansiae]OYO16317.1 DNA polymerase IV [Enemella evansiae]OYO19507.1 DNA polymerase IV [Enemella evansiae]TDO91453.1 DNA polymerase-4 [Enemella evansiae]